LIRRQRRQPYRFIEGLAVRESRKIDTLLVIPLSGASPCPLAPMLCLQLGFAFGGTDCLALVYPLHDWNSAL
jgi:hypothetical protein